MVKPAPSTRGTYWYLLIYLVVTIIIYLIVLALYYYYFDLPVSVTTDKALRTTADVDLGLKAVCSTIVYNAEQPGPNLVKNLYPLDSLGVSRCRKIIASS